jgi:amino acid adenylation domain-containing protein
VTDARAPTLEKREGGRPRPLSNAQERLFLLDQIAPGLGLYNAPTLVRVRATLDEARLRRAFEAVVARHEILRTRIRLLNGELVQEVMDRADIDLAVLDLRREPSVDADAFLADLAGRPFDLGGDVLLRAGLVHLREHEDLLLVVFHHAASDHRSSEILFRELDRLYLGGSLPELPLQYADYAEWQRERLTGAQLEELAEFWRERLAGAPARLELPADRPRPSVMSHRGQQADLELSPDLVERLRGLARSQRVSLFMVLLAAFDTMLYRYTGVDDLVVGTPVSGRHHEQLEPLLGFFTNTIPLRCDLSGDPAFLELLQRAKATTLEALAYHELPFERIVEIVNPERSQAHTPIFQLLFGSNAAAGATVSFAGAELERLPVPGWAWSRFDLSLVCDELASGALRAGIEWATDLFDTVTIERLLGHFETLLRGVADDPSRRLSELPLLMEDELDELLVRWNATDTEFDARPVHDLVGAQAARMPEAVAVVDATSRITYAELERRSNRLARHLRELGIEAGSLVGVCLDRTTDLLVALLAVLKTGSAYVPIDPGYPPDRQRFMLEDAAAPVLLTQERYAGTVTASSIRTVCVDADATAIGACSDEPVGLDVAAQDLMYVIYTSGSTGKPKGVEVRHCSVANTLAQMRSAPGLAAADVVANVTTPSFDIAVAEWFLPLTAGARVVVVPREATLDGVELADWLTRSGTTWLQATPTTLQMLVEAGWKGSGSLKIVCGGEALPRALVPELLSRAAEVWNVYGPTETTIWSSVMRLGPGDGATPIGGPMANTTFYVLDSRRRLVPKGVPGELYIGGIGVARGYHDRPELTEERFVLSPFDQGRLFRTGDLVRWREGGVLEFLGRIDQQVKLRGFRIELGEIEAVLAEVPGVGQAAATIREDVPGDQRLVAYVVPAADAEVDLDGARTFLKTKLPPFMIPSSLFELSSLPLTANGKLDRRALQTLDGGRTSSQGGYAAPDGPVEEAVAELWAEVLRVERVGATDDFFDLGGHSLLAVKMLARLHETLGVVIPLAQLFDASILREFADDVSAALFGAADDHDLAALLAEIEPVSETGGV